MNIASAGIERGGAGDVAGVNLSAAGAQDCITGNITCNNMTASGGRVQRSSHVANGNSSALGFHASRFPCRGRPAGAPDAADAADGDISAAAGQPDAPVNVRHLNVSATRGKLQAEATRDMNFQPRIEAAVQHLPGN